MLVNNVGCRIKCIMLLSSSVISNYSYPLGSSFSSKRKCRTFYEKYMESMTLI